MTVEIKGFGKLTANKDVLNIISMLADEASDRYEELNKIISANQAREIAKDIYDKLEKAGFYDKYNKK